MNNELAGFVEGEVLAKQQWTDEEFTLTVRAQIRPYIAGQFTKLALKNSEDKWLRRAYSFVNSPNHDAGPDVMEFLIINVADGDLSPALASLNQGDTIYVGEKASGFMTLNEIPNTVKDLWLLATGTAIGPYLAMLAEPEMQKRFDDIVLVHAVRTHAELVYQQRIEALMQNLGKKLHYIAIVSREDCENTLSGRIPALLKNNEIANKAGVIPSKTTSFFYLCGNPDMVRDTREVLLELGYEKHLKRLAGQFSFENYW